MDKVNVVKPDNLRQALVNARKYIDSKFATKNNAAFAEVNDKIEEIHERLEALEEQDFSPLQDKIDHLAQMIG